MLKKCSMIYIYLAVIFLSAVLIRVPNVYIQSGCFIGLYIVCLFSIEFDISHPYVWFIPLFTLYSIGYPLMHEHGYYAILPNCGYVETNSSMLFVHWCALCTFIMVVTNKQVKYNKKYNYKFNMSIIKAITFGLIVLLAIQFSTVLNSEFHTKRQILDGLSTNIFFRLGKIAIQLLPIFTALILTEKHNKKINKFFWIGLISIVSLLEMLIIGERSAVIQIIVVEILAYNISIKKIEYKKAFILAGIILVSIIIGVGLKASFGGEQNFDALLSEEPFWIKLFNAEFSSSSINTTNILNHRELWDFGYGIKYLAFLFIPFNFFPFSKIFSGLGYPNLFMIEDNATWYHNVILTGAKSGYGFSMVADGYMELGILGVCILYMILGIMIKLLYKKSGSSLSGLIAYIVFVPIFIYSTRATFLYLVTYLVKYIVLPIVLLRMFKVHRKRDIQSIA